MAGRLSINLPATTINMTLTAIALIGKQILDWATFTKICKLLSNNNIPTKIVDSVFLSLDHPLALPAVVVSLESTEKIQQKIAYNFNNCLSHSYITLIIQCEQELQKKLSRENLTVTNVDEEMILASGSLKDWKNFITQCCSPVETQRIRGFGNMLLVHFKAFKLGLLFDGENIKQLSDGTFILT